MYPLYKNCYALDSRCYDEFGLSEEILMEHAAQGMADFIKFKFPQGSTLLIVAGAGNNGADGIVLARLLYGYCDIRLYLPYGVKSEIAKVQLKRAISLGIEPQKEIRSSDIVVDALFGAGLDRELLYGSCVLVGTMNGLNGYKIACDVPTGINAIGNPYPVAFKADTTITMGALKESLYSDNAKDFVGDVVCVDLGIARELYEIPSTTYLLESADFKPPHREELNTHKGSFGHLAVLSGEKEGASILASLAALRYGAGLVTIIGEPKSSLPYSIMQNTSLPHNVTAIALGMGYGVQWESTGIDEVVKSNLPLLLDADIFHTPKIGDFLSQRDRSIILTPHPREFASLYSSLFGKLEATMLQSNRLYYVQEFCKAYPQVVLLLKGANVLIAQDTKCYINPLGTPKLSKGGSGDVLSGIIGALLAQGYEGLEAAIQGSLALAMASDAYKGNSYSMLPTDLIEELTRLQAENGICY